jgi:hypothetical protein
VGDAGPEETPELPSEACEITTLGPASLRRLTRVEYQNTIGRLLGVTERHADLFADDERFGPFVGNVLPVSNVHVDQYATAAARIAADIDPASLVDCGSSSTSACIETFIRDFGRRAFRRPLNEDEVRRYSDLAATESGVGTGVRIVVEAMLQSPHFLYRIEPRSEAERGMMPLDDWGVATRLSFFIEAAAPDDELLAAADAGALSTREELEVQARRLFDGPLGRATVRRFYERLLHLDRFDQLDKEYPEFDSVRGAMLDETRDFIDWVYFGEGSDGTLETLLTARTAFVDAELADVYGVAHGGEGVEEALLPAGERAGLLTRAAVMAVLGKAAQSAPIQRGVTVIENVLCSDLPDPPAGVEVNDPPPAPDVPRREQFSRHSADPACAGCHSRIDPAGFLFEHYDGMGRFRLDDGGEPVDASGEIVASRDYDDDGVGDLEGELSDAVALSEVLATSREARECMARQWFRFASARRETARDGCLMRGLVDDFGATGFDLRELVVSLAVSEAFRFVDADSGAEEVAP